MTEFAQLLPDDEHNQELQANVHPPDWNNPIPSGLRSLLVMRGNRSAASLPVDSSIRPRAWVP